MNLEIIAEAGSNHNGCLEMAKSLVRAAKDSNATSVKFQFIFPEGLYVPFFYENGSHLENQVFAVRKKELLSAEEWSTVWGYAGKLGVGISASVFCERGVGLLAKLGAPFVKIASTDLTNKELIASACCAFDRVIVSTGMATIAEIDDSVRFVKASFPKTRLELMHCVSLYPCELRMANTQRIKLLRSCFEIPVGYSDHTSSSASATMALVQGAVFFEKHFTLDKSLPGFDHKYASTPAELADYVSTLRDAALGMSVPCNPVDSYDQLTRDRARRGLYAARDLRKGHVISRADLLYVRPSNPSAAGDPAQLIGARLERDVSQYEALSTHLTVSAGQSMWREASQYWSQEMSDKGMVDNESNRGRE